MAVGKATFLSRRNIAFTISKDVVTEKRDVVLGLIEEEELDATVDRIDRALAEKCFPEPNPDWPAVPWPPF